MKGTQKTILAALGVLLLLSTYALIRTGRENVAPSKAAAISAEQATSVDQIPFLTTQELAHMPTSAAELRVAQEALQLGDQDMDLAFASAVLDATRHPAVLSAEAKKIQARLQEAENAFAKQQASCGSESGTTLLACPILRLPGPDFLSLYIRMPDQSRDPLKVAV